MERNLIDQNFKKANYQLSLIDCKKSKIKRDIYKLYDLYLKEIRTQLHNYIYEAVNSLVNISKKISLEENNFPKLVDNNFERIINKILPFLTIEQLSISIDLEKDYIMKKANLLQRNYHLENQLGSTISFGTVHKYDSITYFNQYYKNIIDEKESLNIELDEILLYERFDEDYIKEDNLRFIELFKIEEEDQSLIKLNKDIFIPFELKEIIDWLDTIDSVLNFYLKNLSIEINDQLIKNKLISKCINKDFLNYIFENNLLMNNPMPFILLFDLSLNQFINIETNEDEYYSSRIYLFHIDATELEFYNMSLSSIKSQISQLRFNINSLIKKENYWSNKVKLNLKKESIINNI